MHGDDSKIVQTPFHYIKRRWLVMLKRALDAQYGCNTACLLRLLGILHETFRWLCYAHPSPTDADIL